VTIAGLPWPVGYKRWAIAGVL